MRNEDGLCGPGYHFYQFAWKACVIDGDATNHYNENKQNDNNLRLWCLDVYFAVTMGWSVPSIKTCTRLFHHHPLLH